MTEIMKGITCCADCAYYSTKKHKCTRATDEGKPTDHFYADCPLPTVTKAQGWVSVKDKLPEGDGELYGDGKFLEQSNMVILYGKDPYGRRTFGIGRWIYDHKNTKDSGWNGVMDDDWLASLCTVTHWMPLPEPPKEEAE